MDRSLTKDNKGQHMKVELTKPEYLPPGSLDKIYESGGLYEKVLRHIETAVIDRS